MHRIIATLVLFSLFLASYTQSTLHITGVYLDKKANPLNDATIEYLLDGSSNIGTTISGADGTFDLVVDLTGVDDFRRVFSVAAHPNPFGSVTSFTVHVPAEGKVIITDIKGTFVNSVDLKEGGMFEVTWGGKDKIGRQVSEGAYVIRVSGKGYSASQKVVYQPSGSSDRLRVTRMEDAALKSTADNDFIRFTRDNTTLLELPVNLPSGDTTLGVVQGNPGPVNLEVINDSLFTINPVKQWHLNPLFYNDDQSIYSLPGSDGFSIIEDTLLQFQSSQTGAFEQQVTATDPNDPELEDDMQTKVEVLYTLMIPDYDLVEDTPQDTLIENIDAFKNPLYTGNLSYTIVSQSDPSLIGLSIENNAMVIDSLQADGFGMSTIGIEACDGAYCDTVWFEVTVMPRPDVFGTIMDLFDSTLLVSFAVVYIEENGFMHIDTCDVMGHYHIQLNEEVDSVSFFPVTIRHDDYTPFHTWATVEPGDLGSNIDYRLIDDEFKWDLYHATYISGTCSPGSIGTYVTNCRWPEPPTIHIFNDSSLVSIDIEEHYNNTIENIETILPTFNPVEALPENLVTHPEGFGYELQDGEMQVYWDNDITGGGDWGCLFDGPLRIKCTVRFKESVGIGGPLNGVMSQEIGSVMGARLEPPSSTNYISVFTNVPGANTYTEDDYNTVAVYLNRSLLHYYNLDYIFTEEAYDWEVHPEIVEEYFGSEEDKKTKKNIILVIQTDKETITYDYKDIPSSVMKQYIGMFSQEEIKQQEKKERKARRQARRKGLEYHPPQPISVVTTPAKPAVQQQDGFGQLMNNWARQRHQMKQEQVKQYLKKQKQPFPDGNSQEASGGFGALFGRR